MQPQAFLLNPGSGGHQEPLFALHAGLTVYDERGNLIPRIAEKVPSIDGGDWVAFPDGRMEVTWKLRPDVKWHNGTPLTADDYVFGMRVIMDDEVPARRGRAMQLVGELRAPDPHTLVVGWKSTYFQADDGGLANIFALPRHVLGELYESGNKQALSNSPYWTQEFIGLGPYQLVKWEPGISIEGRAFDQYFLGRPKIDRVIFHYRGDDNAALATLLAGEADLVPYGTFKQGFLPSLKGQWERAGRGTIVTSFRGTRIMLVQFADPTAPWANDVRVRQAFVHMLDRQTLVDTLTEEGSRVAHTLPAPDDPVYRVLEQKGLTIYPFDVARAQTLLGEVGWTRRAGGIYQSGSGQLLSLEVRTSSDRPDNVREAEAVADQLKQAGLRVSTFHIPDDSPDQDMHRAQSTGLLIKTNPNTPDVLQQYHSSQIPTERNRWRGANSGAYSNPVFDQLYDRYLTTLQAAPRNDVLAEMLKIEADHVLGIHLYYDLSVFIAAVRKGLQGPGGVASIQPAQTWNIHTWEMN